MDQTPAHRVPAEPSSAGPDPDCLVVFLVPDLVDDLVGRRASAGLVRVGRFGCRSAAWTAALSFGLTSKAQGRQLARAVVHRLRSGRRSDAATAADLLGT